MNALMVNFFNPDIIAQTWRYLLGGLGLTVMLALLVVPIGLIGGVCVAYLRVLQIRPLNLVLAIYTDIFRALPPLVLLILVYYGAPFAGWELPRVTAVAIAFLLHASSYFGEIFRAGIDAVPAGQWEAARASGLSRQSAFIHVVFPQAVRNVLPDLVGNTIEAVKLTSIASVIALPELLYTARQAQSITMNPTPIIMAGLCYLVIVLPMIRLLRKLEHAHGDVPG